MRYVWVGFEPQGARMAGKLDKRVHQVGTGAAMLASARELLSHVLIKQWLNSFQEFVLL